MYIKHISIWSWIAVGLFLLVIVIFSTKAASWWHTPQTLSHLYQEILDPNQSMFSQAVHTNNAYLLLDRGDYTQALSNITWQQSQDFYNRGVIRARQAFHYATQGTISWLQQASTLVATAQKDFLLADRLQTDQSLQNAIAANRLQSAELDILINAKTCYTISREVIANISWLTQSIDDTKQLLQDEAQALQASSASSTCKQQWQKTISTSQTNLTNLRDILTNQEVVQQKKMLQKRNNPVLCIQPQDVSIVQDIYDMQSKLSGFQQSHLQSLAMRNMPHADAIQELCQAKNDSQINEWIQSTIDKLLTSFQKSGDPSTSDLLPSTNTIQYIPLDANQEKLLESIDKKNKIWIRQIQRLKSDPEYQGMNYIQSLFQEFYGNTGDFQ